MADDARDDLDDFLAEAFQRPGFEDGFNDARDRSELLRRMVACRKQSGRSQTVVAKAMGTTQSAVSELEGGAVDPRLSTLQRYARALDCRISLHLTDATGAALYTSLGRSLPLWMEVVAAQFEASAAVSGVATSQSVDTPVVGPDVIASNRNLALAA